MFLDHGTCHTTGMREMTLLPDLETLDPAALKAMICVQHAELISHRTQIERLELLIAKLRRMQFGRSSEKVERQIGRSADRAARTQAGGTRSQPGRACSGTSTGDFDRGSLSDSQEETGSARPSSSRSLYAPSSGRELFGLQGQAQEARGRCLRDAGVSAGQL